MPSASQSFSWVAQFELAEKVTLGLLPAAEGAETEPQKVGGDFWRLIAFKWILRVRDWWLGVYREIPYTL